MESDIASSANQLRLAMESAGLENLVSGAAEESEKALGFEFLRPVEKNEGAEENVSYTVKNAVYGLAEEADVRRLDRQFERDARRYDGGNR